MRLTASMLSLLLIGAAGMARPIASSASSPAPLAPDPNAPLPGASANCMTEAYAYASVAALAQDLGPDADVFDDALDDLRQQLAVCLAGPQAGLVAAELKRRRPQRHD